MFDKNENADWQAIYNLPLDFEETCYTKCDSYCCTNFYSADFQLLNKNHVALMMPESEFLFQQQLDQPMLFDNYRKEKFTLPNGKSFSIYFMQCEYKGLCNPHHMRPFLCRIYPYFPQINWEGKIIGYFSASLIDSFYYDLENKPCVISREPQKIISVLKKELEPLIQNKEMIFWIKISEALVKAAQLAIEGNLDSSQNRREFLNKYEFTLFTRSCWKSDFFKNEVAYICKELF